MATDKISRLPMATPEEPLPTNDQARRKLRRQTEFLVELSRRHFNDQAAAKALDIKPDTLSRWKRLDKKFRAKYREALCDALLDRSARMALDRKNPDKDMIKHLQNALDPDFKKTTEIKHAGTITHQLGGLLEGMSKEEKEAELARYLTRDESALLDVTEAEFEEA